MKVARALVLSLALVPGVLAACGTSSGCPRGYEVFAGMCVPEGSAPDAAAVGGDAAHADAPFLESADAGPSDAASPVLDAFVATEDAAIVPPDAAPTLPDAFACPYGPLFGDEDGDGFGDPARVLGECRGTLPGWVSDATDCDDARPETHPGASESCNGGDDDCDGMIDEGATTTFFADADADGHGRADATVQACSVPAGHAASSDDCDDAVAQVFPGASESCNARDDDCDGGLDEAVTTTFYLDADGDSYGRADRTAQACSLPVGHASRAGDCDDGYAGSSPAAIEVCDLRDNDCDGLMDELVRTTFYLDADGDGFGDAARATEACTAPGGYVTSSNDCNDTTASIRPGAAETCNDIDDDCDAIIDDGLAFTDYFADCDGDSFHPSGATPVRACRTPTARPTGCPAHLPGAWTSSRSSSSDCADTNADAFPGQTRYFATALDPTAMEELRFDYDCSGRSDRQYTATMTACSGVCSGGGWSTGLAGCGENRSWLTCSSSPPLWTCQSSGSSRIQGCR